MKKETYIEKNSPMSFRVKTISEDIKTEIDKSGMMIIRNVPSTVCNEKNANGRIYSTREFNKALGEANNKSLFESRSLLCTADDHPDSTYPKPSNASHIVIGANIKKIEGKDVLFNDWLVLNTEQGRNLRALIEAGASIGTSIRGLGVQNESTNEIDDYEYLGTDVVGNPSAGTFANFRKLSESLEGEVVVEAVSAKTAQEIKESLDENYTHADYEKRVKPEEKKVLNDLIPDWNKKHGIKDYWIYVNQGELVIKRDGKTLKRVKKGTWEKKYPIIHKGLKGESETYNNNKSKTEEKPMFDLEEAITAYRNKHEVAENDQVTVSIEAISDLLALEKSVLENSADMDLFQAFKLAVLGDKPKLPEKEDTKKTAKAEQAETEDLLNKNERHMEAAELISTQLREQNEELLAENERLKENNNLSNELVAELTNRMKEALMNIKERESSIEEDEKAIVEEVKEIAVKIINDVQTEAKEAISDLETRLEHTIRIGDTISNYFYAAKNINESLYARLVKMLAKEANKPAGDSKDDESGEKVIVQTKESIVESTIRTRRADPISTVRSKHGWK